jgi:hypothetical protein
MTLVSVDGVLLCNLLLNILKGSLALRSVLHNPYLPPATHSLASRVLAGLNLTLPFLDPAQLSHDLMFHTKIIHGIQAVALELCASSWGAMDRSLSLIMHELDPPDDPVSHVHYEEYELLMTFSEGPSTFTLRDLDRLLHPRVPPLVRALPHVESLCLFRREESLEERELRESLRVAISPRHDKETAGAESQPPTIGPALASQVPHPSPHTLADVGASITPAPAFLPPYPQSAALVSPKPPPSPSLTPRVSSPSQLQSQARHPPKSNDTWRPVQAQNIAPLVSGDIEVPEESRSGATAEVLYLGEDEDDEEMPSIDMGSDSD